VRTVQAVWRWLRGVGPNWRERAREARMVDALAEVMAAEMEVDEAAETETTNPVRQRASDVEFSFHETEISQSQSLTG
jgi:hypothetical protein